MCDTSWAGRANRAVLSLDQTDPGNQTASKFWHEVSEHKYSFPSIWRLEGGILP